MTAPRAIDDASAAGVPKRRTAPLAAAGVLDTARAASRKMTRARRPRLPDEERRLLREAEAAFEGGDRRHDADEATPSVWDLEDEPSSRATPSRLFRD